MLVQTRAILFFILIGCAIGVTNGASPDARSDSILSVTGDVMSDIGSHSSANIIRTLKSGGTAMNRILGVLNSAVNFGINETADDMQRVDKFITTTLPQHSEKLKDGMATVGGALFDHGSNTIQRGMASATGIVKTADDVQQTFSEEFNKYVEGVGEVGKSALQATGKATTKVNQLTQGAFNTAGDVVTNPGEYASAGIGHLRNGAETGIGYVTAGVENLRDGVATGTGYVRDGAATSAEYVRDGAITGAGYVRDGAVTGAGYVRDGATTGAGYVRDGATTGAGYISDAASTGAGYVKDGVQAGLNFFTRIPSYLRWGGASNSTTT